MNTVQLECFLAVAEYLNFSRAAESLKITQPAVSHQITSLEDELGARLFIRTSNPDRSWFYVYGGCFQHNKNRLQREKQAGGGF